MELKDDRSARAWGNMRKTVDARARVWVTIFTACWALCPSLFAKDIPTATLGSPLDRGFTGLYNLDFGGAQNDFQEWQRMHPDDPMGPVSEAAGFLFSEFDRLGVLEAQFYENNDAFFARPKPAPDPPVHNQFLGAIARAESLAHARLAENSKDPNALFALTLSSGLRADYA